MMRPVRLRNVKRWLRAQNALIYQRCIAAEHDARFRGYRPIVATDGRLWYEVPGICFYCKTLLGRAAPTTHVGTASGFPAISGCELHVGNWAHTGRPWVGVANG